MAHCTLGVIFSNPSAMRRGILLCTNNSTITMVPVSIMSTFQLMAVSTLPAGRIPSVWKIDAAAKAMIQRFSEKMSSSTYITTKTMSASAMVFILFPP